MAAYVMYGFDSAAELSEETNDPRRTAPRAITRCMLVLPVVGAAGDPRDRRGGAGRVPIPAEESHLTR
jgi:hypothetical protein